MLFCTGLFGVYLVNYYTKSNTLQKYIDENAKWMQ